MPDTPANPVADLLTKSAAPDLVGGTLLPDPRARPFVVTYGEGRPGAGRLTGAMVPLIIGAGLLLVSAIVAFNVLRGPSVSLNGVMGIGLPLLVAAFIAGPALLRTAAGTLQWRRDALIFSDRVEVTDTSGPDAIQWSEPMSNNTDIHQSFVWLRSADGDGDGLELEVVLLRHPDPAKVIYVSGSRKQVMGGMSFTDMVKAGREGRKDEVMASVGDTRNPAVEALVRALGDETGLPLVQAFD